MKKILFVVSHLGSDSSSLCEVLNENPRVQVYNTEMIYNCFEKGIALVSQPHKCDNTAALWAEELLHNHRLSHQCFYKWAKFIYVIKDARHTLHALQPPDTSTANTNFIYYTYRLRRICEMARKTPGAFLLTNLANLQLVEKFLGLRKPLREVNVSTDITPSQFVTSEHIRKGQESFERHYYYLRNLDLQL